jgi:hypothetical protein
MANKKKSNQQTKVFKAPVTIGRETVTITLPKSVIDYINIGKNNEIFWAPVGGVIQISGTQPHLIIPMATIDEHSFMPHDDNARVVEAELE